MNFLKSLKIALKKEIFACNERSAFLFYSPLWQFTFEIFQKMGCPEDQARQATDALLSADLRVH